MLEKRPQEPDVEYRLESVAKRRLGHHTACKECGETRSKALVPGTNPRVCYGCQAKAQGKSEFEEHHVASKNNHAGTVRIPVNDHRARLSVDQYKWPPKTLRNRDRSPLIAAAACIRGFIDMAMYCIDSFLRPVPPFLEHLDEVLIKVLGRHWWMNIGIHNVEESNKTEHKNEEKSK